MSKLILSLLLVALVSANVHLQDHHLCSHEEQQNRACTREYWPVCGVKVDEHGNQTKTTYPNKCVGCSQGADFLAEGDCTFWQSPAKLLCHPNFRNKPCTREYRPVCGVFGNGQIDNYGNMCSACSQGALYVVNGQCE